MKTQGFAVTILSLFISITSFGQKSELKPGYIIKQDNDTLRGFIDFSTNDENARSCRFINQTDNSRYTYSPDQIKGYRIENKYYVAKDVRIDGKIKRVFLEFLVDGIVDLYYLKDALDDYYFIQKDTALVSLTNKDIKVFKEGDGISTQDKVYEGKSNQYKGTLKYLFQESPALKSKIEATPFDYKALVRITKQYHENVCKDCSCIDYTVSTRRKLYIEPSVGMIYTSMGLKTSKDQVTEIKPGGGILIRFISLKEKNPWNFMTGLSYSTNNLEGDFNNDLFTYSSTKIYHLYTQYSILRIPLGLQYSLSSGRLETFLSFSYVNVLLLNRKYASYKTGDGNPTPDELAELYGYQYGAAAGLGVRYKFKNNNYLLIKGEFEYRLSFSSNSDDALQYLNHKSGLLNVGYGFRL